MSASIGNRISINQEKARPYNIWYWDQHSFLYSYLKVQFLALDQFFGFLFVHWTKERVKERKKWWKKKDEIGNALPCGPWLSHLFPANAPQLQKISKWRLHTIWMELKSAHRIWWLHEIWQSSILNCGTMGRWDDWSSHNMMVQVLFW